MEAITRSYSSEMETSFDLLDLRVVRAVADHGSITAAAAHLGYSQPALTQRLRRVERQLGQPLVLRSGRGVQLTEAGRRLALHAVHVQAALDAAQQDLDDLSGGVSGTLRLAGFPSASPTLIPSILSLLRSSAPRIAVTYVEVEPPEALALLRDGAIDLALTFSYPGDGLSSSPESWEGIVQTALYRDTTVIVAPQGVIADSLGDLAAARFIGGCPRCRGHLVATCRTAGFEPDIVLETDNALAVTGLVAAGLGVALLPSLSLLPASLPDGVQTTPLPSASDRIVEVAHSTGGHRIPAVAAALTAILSLEGARFGLRPVTEQAA